MKTFSVAPFPCPNCGHDILLDKLTWNDDGSYQIHALDETFNQQARSDGKFTPGLYARDKAELVRENLSLRNQLFEARLPWWKKLL